MSSKEELLFKAIEAAEEFFAHVIRNEIGDDPDHSAPEDVATKLAQEAITQGYVKLNTGDWRDLLP